MRSMKARSSQAISFFFEGEWCTPPEAAKEQSANLRYTIELEEWSIAVPGILRERHHLMSGAKITYEGITVRNILLRKKSA